MQDIQLARSAPKSPDECSKIQASVVLYCYLPVVPSDEDVNHLLISRQRAKEVWDFLFPSGRRGINALPALLLHLAPSFADSTVYTAI
jgi:hypothetical protein